MKYTHHHETVPIPDEWYREAEEQPCITKKNKLKSEPLVPKTVNMKIDTHGEVIGI